MLKQGFESIFFYLVDSFNMQRSYTKPNTPDNRFILFISGIIAVFVLLILLGAFQLFNEIRSISEGQERLISQLAEPEKEKIVSETSALEGEVVSKIEFVKFKNETNKTIRDLTLEIRLIQTKLRMKKMSLNR